MSVSQIRDGFIKLAQTHDETACLEYINKYDNFANLICKNMSNMLQIACDYKLTNVAFALIDKNCDLAYRDEYGSTALMDAHTSGLHTVVARIIDKIPDITTTTFGVKKISEIMYLARYRTDADNVIKMIDRGYDVYYKTVGGVSLLTIAVDKQSHKIIKRLIDLDTYFAEQFKKYYNDKKSGFFYHTITRYCKSKRATYRDTIIAVMNDPSEHNILYQSFRKTYVVELIDIICDFLILPII
ncbi:MAG: hypothetical protein Faunusvirus15_14 [Faunusvirus sp.]|jgi:hypothetical protein|uniref:Uncharacterized protein n=1 Tax=Faunusvirus sp. TaxID=2487766 RepID=A0A3G5A0U0_9VIRU|nr:MAG: hypothetical protein Faunusvirus15_14 [Faunusvirus sp.]